MSRSAILLATVLGTFLIAPHHSAAQAWLPLKGEGTLSTSFQRVDADGHFLDDGSKLPGYRTQASNLIITVAYGVTENMAVAFTVPFVNVKYLGPEEPLNLPDNVLDDGTYHGTITDLGFQFRYNVVKDPLVVTPFFTAGVPSHAYDTLGEAAPARNFQEYHIGSYVGRLLDPVLPRGFVHASYAYAFVRQDLGIPLNYSTFNFEAGYFVTSSLAASFLYRQQWTHGGLTFDELWEAPPEIFANMDRVVRQNFRHLGVSGSYSLTNSVSVFANYWNFTTGEAAHYGDGFSIGLSWTFNTRAKEILFPTSASSNTGVSGILRGARRSRVSASGTK